MINKIYSGEYVGPVNYRGRLGIRAVLPLTIPTGNTAQCHPHGSVNPEGEHWPPQSTQDSGSFPLPSTAAFQAAEPTQDGADWVPLADEEKQIASFWVSSYTHDLWFEKRPWALLNPMYSSLIFTFPAKIHPHFSKELQLVWSRRLLNSFTSHCPCFRASERISWSGNTSLFVCSFLREHCIINVLL